MNGIASKLLLLLFFVSHATLANNSIVCMPAVTKVENNIIILPGVSKPRTIIPYFIHNISQKSLWIDHPTGLHSANAGWSSYLRPGNWSILLLNRKNFAINCAVIQPGNVDYQNCAKVISICVPQHVDWKVSRGGSYWILEDKSWDDLVKVLEKKASEKLKTLT